ncbi:MAG TPA: hypothetical protein VNT99_03380 [Methylomirabilota bacterium]|nr:hypothetical protein [Methylomirabilota bacterium]
MSKPVVITPSDIRSVVTKEDDFGHEMRIGQLIRGVPGIQMKHGGTYTDPVTQKPRQFDYRCALTKGSARLALAIECKNLSPSVPLVMCGTKRQEAEAFHDLIEARNGNFRRRTATVVGLSCVTRRASKEDTYCSPGMFVAKSIVRIQADKNPMTRTSDADIYDKWSQAISSSIGLAEAACTFPTGATPPKFVVSILPIVVVPDHVMWAASYDERGEIPEDPSEIDRCKLFVAKEIELGEEKTPLYHRFTFSHVHFFSLTGFGAFLSGMAENNQVWSSLFTDKASEL